LITILLMRIHVSMNGCYQKRRLLETNLYSLLHFYSTNHPPCLSETSRSNARGIHLVGNTRVNMS
jgi:hypothetical protein